LVAPRPRDLAARDYKAHRPTSRSPIGTLAGGTPIVGAQPDPRRGRRSACQPARPRFGAASGVFDTALTRRLGITARPANPSTRPSLRLLLLDLGGRRCGAPIVDRDGASVVGPPTHLAGTTGGKDLSSTYAWDSVCPPASATTLGSRCARNQRTVHHNRATTYRAGGITAASRRCGSQRSAEGHRVGARPGRTPWVVPRKVARRPTTNALAPNTMTCRRDEESD
jgi:hypothetical protein